MYLNPQQKAVQLEEGIEIDDKETQQHFDEFYEDVFTELGSFGELEEMHVTGNLGGISLSPFLYPASTHSIISLYHVPPCPAFYFLLIVYLYVSSIILFFSLDPFYFLY